jgi:DNA polymerase-3 subunit gamma/tau
MSCGVCQECLDVSAGRALDVIEIDGASNNGVENVRELIDTVSYMPSSGSKKIYIIDEVHMLSTSAFNALLKTLEEPPPHILFILATTEVHKIPNTILSRCQRFDFRRISTQIVMDQLSHICKAENVTAERDALWLIARQGEGSMRDSLSLLDQVITFTDGPVTLDATQDILGLTDRRLLIETLQALIGRDPQKVIEACTRIFSGGYEAKVFMQDLLELIRHALFLRLSTKLATAVDLPDGERQELAEMCKDLSHEDLHLLFDMCLKGAQDLLRAPDTKIILEMTLLRVSEAPRIKNLSQLFQQIPTPATTPAPASVQAPKSTSLNEKWQDFVHKVKSINSVVGAKLENSFLQKLEQKNVVIGIPPKFKFLQDQVQDILFQKKVQNYMTTFWGPGYSLTFELSDSHEEVQKKTPKALNEQRAQDEQALLRQQIENHPFVKSAQSVFKSEIKAIKEIKS